MPERVAVWPNKGSMITSLRFAWPVLKAVNHVYQKLSALIVSQGIFSATTSVCLLVQPEATPTTNPTNVFLADLTATIAMVCSDAFHATEVLISE